jgi:PAS domain S-box-containing protein
LSRQTSASNPDLYTIGEAAAILGVSPHTIRAWERRHGIVSPMRTRSRQRRYRGEDIDVLREIKKAIDVGGLTLRLATRTVREGGHITLPPVPRRRRQPREPRLLQATQGIWRAVADVMPEVILIINREGVVVECNVAAAKVFGLTRQRVTGRLFPDLVDPFDRSKAVLVYRPAPPAARSWELNLVTAAGSRLFNFHTWPVMVGGEVSLALVGTDILASFPAPSMFGDARRPTRDDGNDLRDDPGSASPLQRLFEQLPVGLAVFTVGREPRIVYANARFLHVLGTPARRVRGKPLKEVIPEPRLAETVQSVLDSRAPASLREVLVQPPAGEPRLGKRLNLQFKPIVSSTRQVTSTLLIAHDVAPDAEWIARLEKLAMEPQSDATVTDLAKLALDYLTSLAPGAEYAVVIARHPGRHESPRVALTTPGWSSFRGEQPDVVIASSVESGRSAGLDLGAGKSSSHLEVRPLVLSALDGRTRVHGAVAWRYAHARPIAPEETSSLESFVPRLSLAAELLSSRTGIGE